MRRAWSHLVVAAVFCMVPNVHAQEPAPSPILQQDTTPAPAPAVAPDPAPATAPAAPAPAAPPEQESRPWEEYGVDDARTGKSTAVQKKEQAAAEEKRIEESRVPWGTAIRMGAITAGIIVGWQVLALPLGLIPLAGTLAQFVGLTLPFLAPGIGWYSAGRWWSVRSPMKVFILAGLTQLAVDVCCLLPLFITPLFPLVFIGRCGVEAAVNGVATALYMRRWGRMKGEGDPELTWDLWETPPVADSARKSAPGAASNPSDFLAPAPASPPPAGSPVPNAHPDGSTVK